MNTATAIRCFALTLCFAVLPARAGIILSPPLMVGSGPSCAYATVQAALDAAAATPGDQFIRITRSQTYSAQALVINDPATVVLSGGYDSCTDPDAAGHTSLAGNNNAPVIRITGPGNVALIGLDLSAGKGAGVAETHGGGILHAGAGALSIASSVIRDNAAQFGSGIAVEGAGSLTLSDTTVRNNLGGAAAILPTMTGVYFLSSGSLQIIGSTLRQNQAGGVRVVSAAQTVIVLSQVLDNDLSFEHGVGLNLSGPGSVMLESVEIRDHGEGGLRYDGGNDVAVATSTISGNERIVARGGGIRHGGAGLMTLTGSVITGNRAHEGSGIAVEGSGSLRLIGTQLTANDANAQCCLPAAAIHFASSGALEILAGSRLSGNESSGAYVERAGLTEIRDSEFFDNDLGIDRGPGLAVFDSSVTILDNVVIRADAAGGMHHGGDGSLMLNNCTITDNGPQAAGEPQNVYGGGGVDLSGSGTVTLLNSTISGNVADLYGGGGIRHTGTGRLEVLASNISGNTGFDGGGLYAEGDGSEPLPVVYLGADTRIVDNHTLGDSTRNEGRGGGAFLMHVDLDLSDAPRYEIARNSATSSGGGLYISGGRARIGSGANTGSIAGNRTGPGSGGGGALYVEGGAEVYLYTTDPEAPMSLLRNVVSGQFANGGAIFASTPSTEPPSAGPPGTHVYAYDIRIAENVASNGGGALMLLSSNTAEGTFCLGRASQPDSCEDLGGTLPAAARSCAPGIACNTLEQNVATGIVGGAAVVRGGGEWPANIRLVGASIQNNSGRSIVASLPQGPSAEPIDGVLDVRDSLVAHNSAGNALFDGVPAGIGFPAEASHALGVVNFERSTVGCNAIGAPYVFGTRINLRLVESIVHQPGIAVHAGNPSGVFARHVLANEVATLPARIDVVAGNPAFVFDDGVDCDLHLGPQSPALDFSNHAGDGLDLEGNARGQDLAAVPNRFGPRDLGAYEQAGTGEPPAPYIFGDGFEDAP